MVRPVSARLHRRVAAVVDGGERRVVDVTDPDGVRIGGGGGILRRVQTSRTRHSSPLGNHLLHHAVGILREHAHRHEQGRDPRESENRHEHLSHETTSIVAMNAKPIDESLRARCRHWNRLRALD